MYINLSLPPSIEVSDLRRIRLGVEVLIPLDALLELWQFLIPFWDRQLAHYKNHTQTCMDKSATLLDFVPL
jgi:hypothetical protein